LTATIKAGSDPRLTLSPGVPVALVRGITTCLPVTGRRVSILKSQICNLKSIAPPAFGDQRRQHLAVEVQATNRSDSFGIRQACAAWTAPEEQSSGHRRF